MSLVPNPVPLLKRTSTSSSLLPPSLPHVFSSLLQCLTHTSFPHSLSHSMLDPKNSGTFLTSASGNLTVLLPYLHAGPRDAEGRQRQRMGPLYCFTTDDSDSYEDGHERALLRASVERVSSHTS
ncbi:hypothetical protein Q7C36_008297 [Tachysurus vachellii]|uniref:Uncharacterized protein n=1 Tax=Tachysurus vachellii TaxID=175792 RepID=A0AA88T0B0_TACVA|nr:hypothetical protein Q7C36_008297 [Tachysurus vachellii]